MGYANREFRYWYDDDDDDVSLCFAGRVPADSAPPILDMLHRSGGHRVAGARRDREVQLGITTKGATIVNIVTRRQRAEIRKIITQMPAKRRTDLIAALESFAVVAAIFKTPASGAIFTLEDFYHRLPIRQDVRAILPLVDGGRYTAMVTANDRHDIPRQDWSTHTVMDIAHPDWRTGEPDETLRDALRIMESAAVTAMAVVGPDASYRGMISTAEILRLDEILGLDD